MSLFLNANRLLFLGFPFFRNYKEIFNLKGPDVLEQQAKWSSHLQFPLQINQQTSWSLLGLGVEVGLAPNIMKGINIFNGKCN
jgi:hypothetical protein